MSGSIRTSNLFAAEDYGHWDIDNIFNPEDYYGFIYIITNKVSNKKYIGQKSFKTLVKNWKTYISSCIPLVEDINILGKDSFTFKIKLLCVSKEELNKAEQELQTKYNVLYKLLPNGEKEYYNRYIHNKKFFLEDKQKIKDRNKKVVESRLNNKKFKELANTSNEYFSFKHNKTGEIFNGTIKEFSEFSSLNAILCAKLTTGDKKLVSSWILLVNGARFYLPYSDDKIYHFKNIKTKEVFTGTQILFKNYTGIGSSLVSGLVNHNLIKTQSWILCDNLGNDLVSFLYYDKRVDIIGNKHHRADLNIYKIKNVKTNEYFVGTRADMKEKLNLTSDGCHGLIHGYTQLHKHWALINDKDEYIYYKSKSILREND